MAWLDPIIDTIHTVWSGKFNQLAAWLGVSNAGVPKLTVDSATGEAILTGSLTASGSVLAAEGAFKNKTTFSGDFTSGVQINTALNSYGTGIINIFSTETGTGTGKDIFSLKYSSYVQQGVRFWTELEIGERVAKLSYSGGTYTYTSENAVYSFEFSVDARVRITVNNNYSLDVSVCTVL